MLKQDYDDLKKIAQQLNESANHMIKNNHPKSDVIVHIQFQVNKLFTELKVLADTS